VGSRAVEVSSLRRDYRKSGKHSYNVSADVHARLGNEAAALACCARLPDDFWTPGIYGAPGGGKADIADKLRHSAVDARNKPE